RRGQSQLALLHTDAAGLTQLAGLGHTAAVSLVPRSTVATVLLRPVTDELSDARVRRALAALLDRDVLIATGTKGGAALRAEAQVLAPAAPGYQPRKPVPSSPDPALAQSLLGQAGYNRTVGAWLRDGKALTLTIG